MSCKVLVTSGGSLLGQGIIRALIASGMDVQIGACDPEPYSAGLYWVDEAYKVPYARTPEYVSGLTRAIKKFGADMVLVGTDHELPILSRFKGTIEKETGCQLVVSDPLRVEIANDKWLTYEWLKGNGIDCPDSALGDDADDLVGRVGFPIVAKPRISQRSVGMRLIHNVRELDRLLDYDAMSDRMIFQECVGTSDTEYTAGTLCLDGKVVSIVMRRILRDGNTHIAFVEPYPELNQWIRDAALLFGAYGPANFQFRIGEDGKPRIFEINARFSGTTGIRYHAGYNDVEMLIRALMYGTPLEQPSIQPCAIMRHFSETVILPDGVKF